MPNGVRSCVMWTRSLEDTRRYSTNRGQNLYVKLAALDMERKRKNQNKKKLTIGLIVCGSLLLLLIVGVVTFCCWKRYKNAVLLAPVEVTNQSLPLDEEEMTNGGLTSPFIQFDVIAQATNNFQDKIGSGGFANVYRGRLVDGRDIAVKRLYKLTDDAIQGFWNEVNLIALLQHTNLVRVIGYFHDPETKILVYEYLPNSSLNTYIYKTTRSNVLDWNKRMDIAKGIARGLLYLHQDSRVRVIHLDLKLSNVLLCDQMIPKISDFGTAKRLDGEDTQAVTNTVTGTRCYMAPEYAIDGVCSLKADVFSFGVLLLEMVSGINVIEFNKQDDGHQRFLRFTWNLWLQGKVLKIVDQYFTSSSSSTSYQPEEALRCIQIALLCVQAHAEDRPLMDSIILMLGSQNEVIRLPKPPLEADSLPEQDPQDESSTTSTVATA
ncbi:Receptor-like serine/threonine-protein kinase SD1-6 [Raphanus sativus]|nr:Receptor-like serine/threonine-protein kinase SD1-6 [Raphanus sativus]